MALTPCSPCEHGKDFVAILEAPAGSTVWDPACTDSKGNMRAHVVGAEEK